MFFSRPRAPAAAGAETAGTAFVPQRLPRVGEDERPVVTLASATHDIEGVRLERGVDSLARYTLRPYDELRSMPRLVGDHASAFGPDGRIAGSAARQWGRQAIGSSAAAISMTRTCSNGASSWIYERKAARRHAQYPQGAVAVQPPHGDPRAARRTARARRRTWCSCRKCRASTSASRMRFAGCPVDPQHAFLAGEDWQHVYGCNAVYDHGHHGNAILSRFGFVSFENEDVSDHRYERRGLLHSVVAVPGWRRNLHCVCVHLRCTSAGATASSCSERCTHTQCKLRRQPGTATTLCRRPRRFVAIVGHVLVGGTRRSAAQQDGVAVGGIVVTPRVSARRRAAT